MRKAGLALRILLRLATAASAAALLWAARAAFPIGRDQAAAYAAQSARQWATAGVLFALYLLADLWQSRRREGFPGWRDRLWLLADMAVASVAFVKAFVALSLLLSAKSFQVVTLENLNGMRQAVADYQRDKKSGPPADWAAFSKDYLADVPRARLWLYHPDSSAVGLGTRPDDAGGWMYDNVAGDANYGRVWINCTHDDWKGGAWSAY